MHLLRLVHVQASFLCGDTETQLARRLNTGTSSAALLLTRRFPQALRSGEGGDEDDECEDEFLCDYKLCIIIDNRDFSSLAFNKEAGVVGKRAPRCP